VSFVGLLCGGNLRSDLVSAGAHSVWMDPEDLRRHLDRVML
jgi:hypothetical protein